MNEIENVAVDLGFNRVKFRSPDKRGSFASVVGRAETGGLGFSLAGNGLKVRLGESEHWTPLGETALRRQRQAVGRRDGSWVLSPEWSMLLCGALGQLVEGDASIRLVTGLPVNDHERYRQPLYDKLAGKSFAFQLHGHERQTVKIEAVKIPPQPIGSLFGVAFDAYGNSKENDFSTAMGAIVDIGGHTTNILTVDALATVSQDSRALGLLHELDSVTRRINQEYPLLEFTTHDVAVAMENGKFWNGRENVGIEPFVRDYLNEFTAKIASYVRNKTPRAGRLHWLLLTGGGVEAVGDRLVENLSADYGHIQIADDPMWANVNGYLALARRATKKGLWS